MHLLAKKKALDSIICTPWSFHWILCIYETGYCTRRTGIIHVFLLRNYYTIAGSKWISIQNAWLTNIPFPSILPNTSGDNFRSSWNIVSNLKPSQQQSSNDAASISFFSDFFPCVDTTQLRKYYLISKIK